MLRLFMHPLVYRPIVKFIVSFLELVTCCTRLGVYTAWAPIAFPSRKCHAEIQNVFFMENDENRKSSNK